VRKGLLFGSVLLVALSTGLLMFLLWPREEEPSGGAAERRAEAQAPAVATPRIKATLFYVSPDGSRLTPAEREVPFGEGTIEQAKRIVEAELAPAPSTLVSPIPAGTTLRALFVTDRGEAYVDLSREVAAAHPGGSMNEILTVYAIVNSLTANLPAVSSVQILVDGREVDTLAGHVDLRRPLAKGQAWVEQPAPAGGPDAVSRRP
jgi:spore germination protein GerM